MLQEEIRSKMVERADLVGQQEELEMLVDELYKTLSKKVGLFTELHDEYNRYVQTRRLYYDHSRKDLQPSKENPGSTAGLSMKAIEYSVVFDKEHDLLLLEKEFKSSCNKLIEQMQVSQEEDLRVMGDYIEVQDKLILIDGRLYANTQHVESTLEPKSKELVAKVLEMKAILETKNTVMLQLVEQQDRLDRETFSVSRKTSGDADHLQVGTSERMMRDQTVEREQILSDLETFMKQKEALLKRKSCLRDELAKLLEHQKLMQAIDKVNEKKLNLQYLLREKRALEIELWKLETEIVDNSLAQNYTMNRVRAQDYSSVDAEEIRTLSHGYSSVGPQIGNLNATAKQNTFNSFLECLSRQSYGIPDYAPHREVPHLHDQQHFEDVSRISSALSQSRLKQYQNQGVEDHYQHQAGDLLSLHEHFSKHRSGPKVEPGFSKIGHRARESNFSDMTSEGLMKASSHLDERTTEGMYHSESYSHKRGLSGLSDVQKGRRPTQVSLAYANDEYASNDLGARRITSPSNSAIHQNIGSNSGRTGADSSRVKGLEQLLMGSTRRKLDKGVFSEPVFPNHLEYVRSQEPQLESPQISPIQNQSNRSTRPKHFSLVNPSQIISKPFSNKYIGPASPTVGELPFALKAGHQYSSLRDPNPQERSHMSQISSILPDHSQRNRGGEGSYTPQKSDYGRTQPYMKFGLNVSRDGSSKLIKSKNTTSVITQGNLRYEAKENEGEKFKSSDTTYLGEFLTQTRRKPLQVKASPAGRAPGGPGTSISQQKVQQDLLQKRPLQQQSRLQGNQTTAAHGKLSPSGSRSRSPLHKQNDMRNPSLPKKTADGALKSSETLICPYFSTEQTSRSHSQDLTNTQADPALPQSRNVLYAGFREGNEPVLHKTPTQSSIQKQSSGSQFHSLQNNQEYNSLLFGTDDRSADMTLHSHSKSYTSAIRQAGQGLHYQTGGNKFEGLKMNSNFKVFKRPADPREHLPTFSPFTYSSVTPKQAGYYECDAYYESGFFAFFVNFCANFSLWRKTSL